MHVARLIVLTGSEILILYVIVIYIYCVHIIIQVKTDPANFLKEQVVSYLVKSLELYIIQ
jgi:hypothetical protein